MFRPFLAIIALACFGLLTDAQAAPDITGPAKVRSGDQVQVGNSRIRLQGIDAPSLDQLCLDAKGERWNCGITARDELIKRTDGKSWTCAPARTDRFGRTVAKCLVDGEDIQKWLVRSGWALSFVQYSRVYDPDEKEARTDKAGLWAGAFVAPWEWRVRKKSTVLGSIKPPEEANAALMASASGASMPSANCNIKGNVNRAGVCIYHTPNSRWYAKISMKVSKGTRWFCSVEEAEAAGCRETRR